MKIKMNKKVLAATITVVLTGVTLNISTAYAEKEKSTADKNKTSDNNNNSDKKKSKADNEHYADSGSRGEQNEKKKITICHVPKGKPENRHTIHIGFSAWEAHKKHPGDHLGSCNNPPSTLSTRKAKKTTSTTENLHVIKGCTGIYLEKLVTATQSYFEPIIVSDAALDDKAVVTAVSECLDKGDSSDSGKSNSDSSKKGKNNAHDSVSDSSNHHVIRGCENKGSKKSNDSGKADSNDSKNYRKKLTKAINAKNSTTKDNLLIVSDSSLDDSSVRAEYRNCVSKSDSSNSSKVRKNKGDSGHKYREVKDCKNDSAIKAAIEKHHQKVRNTAASIDKNTPLRPIIITDSAYKDTVIKSAVTACLDPDLGKGSETIVKPVNGQYKGYAGRLNWREKSDTRSK